MLSSYTKIGSNHIHLKEVDSTNTYALDLLSKTNPIDGTVISADFQHSGKGQFDRKWASSSGESLTFSIILYPNFISVQNQFDLSKIISISICQLLKQKYNLEPKIKWPNDIYVGDKKIAGILIINQIMSTFLKSSTVGIGINVNQTSFSQDLSQAISIYQVIQKNNALQVVLNDLCRHIEYNYNAYKANTLNVKLEYLSLLYYFKQNILFALIDQDEFKTGIIDGVDIFGRLIITTEESHYFFNNGEVKVIYKK
jgi:BirA family transcriptional regulator, biotin operon repressor / biotin---[acetyl-CoA-carboxylase] ligase